MDRCDCECMISADQPEVPMAKRRRVPLHFQDEDSNPFYPPGCQRPAPSAKPVQRNTANARERARMRILSKAFFRLKGKLPFVPQDTKLSKLDTLRLASTYIAHLRKVLRDDGAEGDYAVAEGGCKGDVHPINLTWPFTINSKSVHNDCSSTSSSLESNKQSPDDFQHDATLDYRNFPSCEYFATNHPVYHQRMNSNEQFYQQWTGK